MNKINALRFPLVKQTGLWLSLVVDSTIPTYVYCAMTNERVWCSRGVFPQTLTDTTANYCQYIHVEAGVTNHWTGLGWTGLGSHNRLK